MKFFGNLGYGIEKAKNLKNKTNKVFRRFLDEKLRFTTVANTNPN